LPTIRALFYARSHAGEVFYSCGNSIGFFDAEFLGVAQPHVTTDAGRDEAQQR
jgi:hypothetical protein